MVLPPVIRSLKFTNINPKIKLYLNYKNTKNTASLDTLVKTLENEKSLAAREFVLPNCISLLANIGKEAYTFGVMIESSVERFI